MPDVVVHYAMGDRVLARLNQEISDRIDRERFRFALMGPDPYLYYRFFAPHLRGRVHRRSSVMHGTKTGEFLTALAGKSHSREMFSLLCGFLCHYALDATAHPYINQRAGSRAGMHMAIERKLDVMELERQGKAPRDIVTLLPKAPDLREINEAIRAVYGWDDDLFRVSCRHMRMYHWIVKDQHGFLAALLQGTNQRLAALSYRHHLCDGMDLSGFAELEARAVALGQTLITAAYRYQAGLTGLEDLQAVIGNRSYDGHETDNPS